MLEWIGGITVTFFMVTSAYFLVGSIDQLRNNFLPKHYARDTTFLVILFVTSVTIWWLTVGQNIKVLWRG